MVKTLHFPQDPKCPAMQPKKRRLQGEEFNSINGFLSYGWVVEVDEFVCVSVCVCVCVHPHECACLSFSFFAHLSKAGRLAVFQDGVRLPHQPFHPPHLYSQVRCSCFPGVWLQRLEWSGNSTESNIAGLICLLLWQGLRTWNGALIFGSSTACERQGFIDKILSLTGLWEPQGLRTHFTAICLHCTQCEGQQTWGTLPPSRCS